MEGRCGRIMQTSTHRVKTQRVVITFLRVVDLIQSQRIFLLRVVTLTNKRLTYLQRVGGVYVATRSVNVQ